MTNQTTYDITNKDRMFVYLWSEDDNECKFGQRFVFLGQDPHVECNKRIRESLGVRKDKFDGGGITVHGIFDVSEYAKKNNIFDKKSKVDDHIRKEIGFVKQGEVHSVSAEVFIKYFTNYMIKSMTVFRPKYVPRFYQDYVHMLFIEKLIESNKEKIDFALELAPRFGKTIWAINLIQTLFNDFGYKICFLPSYMLTVMPSFKKDFYGFDGYTENMVYVSDKEDLNTVINECYGKKMIIVETSLHMNEHESKLDLVNNIPVREKVCFMDEADFGTHRIKSQDFIRFINSKLNVYMTGTAIEKVIKPLENIDDNIIRWSYTDMLMVKNGQHPLQKFLANN